MCKIKTEEVILALENALPAIFTRNELEKISGGVFIAKTIANLGKEGPPFTVDARKAIYIREQFIKWLRAYWASLNKRKDPPKRAK